MRTRDIRAALIAAAVLAACAPDVQPATQAAAVSDQAPVPGTPASSAQTALYELFVRDFSPEGTLQGVIRGLDRVEATGVEYVWLMPLHPIGEQGRKGPAGAPGSSYSVRDYHAINPDYGTDADLKELVSSIHGRGMKVMLGWVPNHTSWDNVWVTEHPDYYVRDENGEMTVPRDLGGNLTDWTDVAQLDYGNAALRQAMIDAMKYWLETFDLDGFRMDVAGFIPDTFWQDAASQLNEVKPVLLLAEWDSPAMLEDGFDIMYPWSSYGRLKEVWKGRRAAEFIEGELDAIHALPAGGLYMRMTTNHDETAWDAPPVTLFGGPAGARAAFVAEALLPGPPMLYNGQEVESPQQLGLFVKQAIDWDQAGADEARTFYRTVIELSRTNPSLSAPGGLEIVRTDAEQDVIAYRRGEVVVLVNARPQPVTVTAQGVDVAGWTDLLTGAAQEGAAVSLPAYGAVVLAREAAD